MLATYDSFEAEEFTVALKDDCLPSSAASTVASSETDHLVDKETPENNGSLVDGFLKLLGFSSNPLAQQQNDAQTINNAAADMRLSMLSNFSSAYNIVSISLSLHIMDHIYSATAQDESICSSALIAGMIIGQFGGGTLGDVLGRHRAMGLVLAIWRFILGLGCGGVYPLAATLTAESSQSKEDRGKNVALTFSLQGVGYLAVPILAWSIVSILGEESDIGWRLILGGGCVPGVVLAILRSNRVPMQKSKEALDVEAQARVRAVPVSVFDAILAEEDLVKKFLGTGGCWLLFDILFYGNTLFQPVVLSTAFGPAETVQKAARDTGLISLLALPGYFVSVYAVGRQSPRYIQLQGFLAMAVMYIYIGVCFDALSAQREALLLVYGSTFFFSNYGPNVTTFMLPSITFSRPCRSTLNGLCAASGKAGALIGAMVFVTASRRFGEKTIFLSCGLVALLGSLVTILCVSEESPDESGLTANTSFHGLSSAEIRQMVGERRSKVPMKVVYSQPSLVDYNSMK